MRLSATHDLKNRLNKYLLALAILASIFAFSGFNASSQIAGSQVQTTWLVSTIKPAVNGVRYSALKPGLSASGDSHQISCCLVWLSQIHSKATATRFKVCNDLNLLTVQKLFKRIPKTIPQNDEAEQYPGLA